MESSPSSLKPNPKFGELADDSSVQKAVEALKKNGIEAEVVENAEAARSRVLEIIPAGVAVMTMSSQTLLVSGIAEEIEESGRYKSVRKKLTAMGKEMTSAKRQLGAAPEWVIGSVHAVTEDGKVAIASNTGSQLPAYAYGSSRVVWVVGTQKIVPNFDEAIKRIYEYALPLEDARFRKAYGKGSNVSKILIVNKEIQPSRIHLIFVKEKLGF